MKLGNHFDWFDNDPPEYTVYQANEEVDADIRTLGLIELLDVAIAKEITNVTSASAK